IPNPHRLVPTDRDQPLSIRAEQEAGDKGGVATKGKYFVARRRVPEPHRLVHAGRGQALAVGTERHAEDARVAHECEESLPGLHVIDAYTAVRKRAPHCQALSVRTEGHTPNSSGAIGEREAGS